MTSVVHRILAMAVRVLDFIRANPSTEASYVTVVSRLEERLKRADTLAVQEHDGLLQERNATARRLDLRRTMHQDQLRHLAKVAEMATKERPDLAGKFALPLTTAPHKTFFTAASAMLARAVQEKDLLVGLGLGDTFLDDLARNVAEFDEVTTQAHEGRRSHVGARADLDAVTEEIRDLVVVLDGLNRARYRDDAELLAAWESARNVVGPFRSSKPSGSPPDTGVVPPEGGVAPAA